LSNHDSHKGRGLKQQVWPKGKCLREGIEGEEGERMGHELRKGAREALGRHENVQEKGPRPKMVG